MVNQQVIEQIIHLPITDRIEIIENFLGKTRMFGNRVQSPNFSLPTNSAANWFVVFYQSSRMNPHCYARWTKAK